MELSNYLSVLDEGLKDLKPIAEKVSARSSSSRGQFTQHVKGSLIVMVSNFGNSDLLINFCCAAKRVGVDIGKILMFATDVQTAELAESLGFGGVYHHPKLFAAIPKDAPIDFGDEVYTNIMMAKIYCVHLISMLGYDFLFQDLDIIPYQAHYLDYFVNRATVDDEFDMFFQHDFSPRLEYAPL